MSESLLEFAVKCTNCEKEHRELDSYFLNSCGYECMYDLIASLISKKEIRKMTIGKSTESFSYEDIVEGQKVYKIKFYAKTLKKTNDLDRVNDSMEFNKEWIDKRLHKHDFSKKMEELLK
jgi:hypothetical protein